MVHYPGELMIPEQDKKDTRDVVKLHGIQCQEGDWAFGWTESELEAYEAQSAHYNETDHTGYWHWKIERDRARIVHPAKGHW